MLFMRRSTDSSRQLRFGRKPKLRVPQINRARKVTYDGQRPEDVAGLSKVNRSPLCRAL